MKSAFELAMERFGGPLRNYTPEQKAALWFLLKDLKQSYPQAKICGHRDFPNVAKKCPCYLPSKEYAALQPRNQ